jgi:hypothetical protein
VGSETACVRRLFAVSVALALFAAGCDGPQVARNPARDEMAPIVERLSSVRAERLCEAGHGRGIDNLRPWYDLYLTADAAPDLVQIVKAAALESGFALDVDEKLLEEFKYLLPDGGRQGPDTGYRGVAPFVTFDETSTFLVAEREGRTLQAFIIVRIGTANTYCGGLLGRSSPPPVDRAIVRLFLSLPET